MRSLATPVIVLLCTTATFFAAPFSTATSDPGPLIVHEWGTFTSIAGADGTAVEWLPLAGPADLPCFVETSRFNVKEACGARCEWRRRCCTSMPRARRP